jgi:hypothetical protein
MDQGDVDLRRTSDLDDIDTAHGNRQFDTETIENTVEENTTCGLAVFNSSLSLIDLLVLLLYSP